MEWILRLILCFYPPAFRHEFGDEMAEVFYRTAAEKRLQGLLALLGWLLVELLSGWRVAMGMQLSGLAKGANMEKLPPTEREEALPRWAIPVILVFFLFLSVPNRFYNLFPDWMINWVIIALALVTFVGPLVIGLVNRLPRWSLLFTGAFLGAVGFYGSFVMIGIVVFLLNPVSGLMKNPFAHPDTMFWDLFYQWFLGGVTWFGTILVNIIFLSLVALFRGLKQPFWRDLSLLSFSLYGGILFNYMLAFDEYAHVELVVFTSMVALALGAWLYLRSMTPGRRTLALLAGLTVAMAIMGVGKYYLVPLQDWGPWLPNHPPESQRWFESLSTILSWFWMALSIGLLGLFQVRRKEPVSPEPAAPA